MQEEETVGDQYAPPGAAPVPERSYVGTSTPGPLLRRVCNAVDKVFALASEMKQYEIVRSEELERVSADVRNSRVHCDTSLDDQTRRLDQMDQTISRLRVRACVGLQALLGPACNVLCVGCRFSTL